MAAVHRAQIASSAAILVSTARATEGLSPAAKAQAIAGIMQATTASMAAVKVRGAKNV